MGTKEKDASWAIIKVVDIFYKIIAIENFIKLYVWLASQGPTGLSRSYPPPQGYHRWLAYRLLLLRLCLALCLHSFLLLLPPNRLHRFISLMLALEPFRRQ